MQETVRIHIRSREKLWAQQLQPTCHAEVWVLVMGNQNWGLGAVVSLGLVSSE